MNKYKKKSLDLLSKTIREETPYCTACGSTRHLQCCHILSKETHPNLALESNNVIVMCASCHKFGRLSLHRNPVWFAKFMKETHPNKWKWALEHCEDYERVEDEWWEEQYNKMIKEL